jgi:hypothetical protein
VRQLFEIILEATLKLLSAEAIRPIKLKRKLTMKKLIITLVMTCFIGAQAYGFTGASFVPNLSVSWWNPVSYVVDAYDWGTDLVDSYFSDDEEEELGPVYSSNYDNSISNSWFNLTAFPIQQEMYGSCMATNSNGPACVICRNSGLIALSNIQSNLMCTMDRDSRKDLITDSSCKMSKKDKNQAAKCTEDDSTKKQYCNSCLADNGTGLPDKNEMKDLMKKAVEVRKDEIIKQTFKDYKEIAEETLDFAGNPFLQEGIGENFLCSPGKIMNLKEMLMNDPRSGCKESTMDDVKKTIVGFAKHCLEKGGLDCPDSLKPGQPLPDFMHERAVGPPTADGVFPTVQLALGGESALSVIDRLIVPEERMRRIAGTLNGLPGGSLRLLVNGQTPAAESFNKINTEVLDQLQARGEDFNKSSIQEGGHNAVENLTDQTRYEGSVLVASNMEIFSIDNYLANLKKVFDPSFNCEGENCKSLYTFLEFDPSVGKVLNRALLSTNGSGIDTDYKQAINNFKEMYRVNARKDLAKSEFIKKLNLRKVDAINRRIGQLESEYALNNSEELKEKIEKHKNKIIALNTENNDREMIIMKQENFLDQLKGNVPIDANVFRDTVLRMQQSRIEDLNKKCQDVVKNIAQICKMDNKPKDYKASDLVGLDFTSNDLLAEKLIDGNYSSKKDKDAKVNKIATMLDKAACYEQNKYSKPSLKVGAYGLQTFYDLNGEASTCDSPGQLDGGKRSQFAIFEKDVAKEKDENEFIEYNYQTIGKCPQYYGARTTEDEQLLADSGLGDAADGDDYNIGGVNENGMYTPVMSNPQSSVASAINKIRKNKKYSDKISSDSVNNMLMAAGGSGTSVGSLTSNNKTSSGDIEKEITTSPQEVSSQTTNAVNDQVNNQVVDGVTNQQLAKIGQDISNNASVKKKTEDIIRNDKSVGKIEQTIDELKTIQSNTDSPELKSELDLKLAELQKQIEELKKQNSSLKSNRDLEIARLRDEKIQQQIATNNAATGAFEVQVATENNVGSGTTASVSGQVVNNSSGAGSFGSISTSSASTNAVDSTADVESNNSVVQNTTNTSIQNTGLESQGLILDRNALKLVAENGEVLAAGDDLLIVGESIKLLKNAKALALSKKKQAFVFKGKAYMKRGRDYVLAPKRFKAPRRQIANIESIRQIDSLLETLKEDPFEFEDTSTLTMTQLDPIPEIIETDGDKLKRERAHVSDLLDKLRQGLSL